MEWRKEPKLISASFSMEVTMAGLQGKTRTTLDDCCVPLDNGFVLLLFLLFMVIIFVLAFRLLHMQSQPFSLHFYWNGRTNVLSYVFLLCYWLSSLRVRLVDPLWFDKRFIFQFKFLFTFGPTLDLTFIWIRLFNSFVGIDTYTLVQRENTHTQGQYHDCSIPVTVLIGLSTYLYIRIQHHFTLWFWL